MTDAERRWLESRGWIKADLSKGWHHASLGWQEKTGEPWLIDEDDAVGVERGTFEAECREQFSRSLAKNSNVAVAEEHERVYRKRFGLALFETESVEATKNQEVEQ